MHFDYANLHVMIDSVEVIVIPSNIVPHSDSTWSLEGEVLFHHPDQRFQTLESSLSHGTTMQQDDAAAFLVDKQ
jgi:hypothetical protein